MRSGPDREERATIQGATSGSDQSQTSAKASSMRFLPSRLIPRTAAPSRSPDDCQDRIPPAGRRVCVHGLFRSGTNLFRAIMETNFDCKVSYDDFGWKHAFFPIATRYSKVRLPSIPSVVMTKNPLAALDSLFRYANHNPRNIRCDRDAGLSGFLRGPIVIFDGGNPSSVEYRFRSPVDYWNAMNWNLFSLVRKSDEALHVRYEDLLSEPEQTVGRVAGKLKLVQTSDDIVVPSQRLNNLGSKQHNLEKFFSSQTYDKSGFVSGAYAARFGPADLEYLDAELCWPLVEDLGYAAECRLALRRVGKPADAQSDAYQSDA